MELETNGCYPFTKHIQPAIAIDVELRFSDKQIPVEVGGRIEAGDGTILGHLHEYAAKESPDKRRRKVYASNSYDEGKDSSYKTTLYSPIGRQGVEYLDQLRDETKKNALLLNLVIVAEVLESNTKISSMHRVSFSDAGVEEPDEIQNYDKSSLIAYGYDRDINPSHNEMWILSGGGGADFLHVSKQVESEISYRIPSRDWTDDFLPEFGFGGRLIVDIPDPSDFHNEDIGEGLVEAYKELEKAEAELQRGEWRSVVSHMLGVYDTIKDEELWSLQESGYTEEAEGGLTGLQSNFNDFLGKFRHRRGKGGNLQDKTEPHREDAYFMYSMMAGLVQLLAKKHQIRTTKEE
jgi:hypothetical protein